jgi:beta-glucanase (GH16 family)
MISLRKGKTRPHDLVLMVLSFLSVPGFAQTWDIQPHLSDEFNYPAGTAIGVGRWEFISNTFSSSDVHRFTDRQYNVPADSHLTDYNLRTTGSSIQIVARKLYTGGYQYSSAGINSRCKMAFTHGKIEFRLKPPSTTLSGLWLEFYLTGCNAGCSGEPSLGWPACGEIDVWEYQSWNPSSYFTAGFCNTSCGATERTDFAAENQAGVWRIYSCERDSASVTYWYRNDNDPIDTKRGLVTKSLSGCSCFGSNMYYVLRMAVGGALGGTISCAFPETLEIDYIRTYTSRDSQTSVKKAPSQKWPASFGGRSFKFLHKQSAFQFISPQASHTRIYIHDLRGKLAAILIDGWLPAGAHYFPWTPRRTGSGVFIATVQSGETAISFKAACY